MKKIEFKKQTSLFKYIKKNYKPKKSKFDMKTFFSAPSIWSTLVLIIAVLLIKVLSCSQVLNNFPISFIKNLKIITTDDSLYSIYLSIHKGIGAIIVGLVFFIANSLSNNTANYKGKALLYKSGIYPLIVSEVLLFFIFASGSVNEIIIVLIILVGFGAIWSLYNVISILSSNSKMEQAENDLVYNVIIKDFRRIINNETIKKYGNIALHNEYDDNKTLKTKYFTSGLIKDSFIPIKSYKDGILSDINIKKLEMFIRTLRQRYKLDDEKLINDGENKDLDIVVPTLDDNKETNLAIIIPAFQKEIKKGDTLLWINKNLKDYIENENYKLQSAIFTIISKRDITKSTRLEIAQIKERAFLAINSSENTLFEKQLDFYSKLLNEFVNTVGPYKNKDVSNERSMFNDNRFETLDWIYSDIRKIFEKCILFENIELTDIFMNKITQFIDSAIKNQDFLLFKEFLTYFQLLFYLIKDRKDDFKKSINEQHIWKHLNSLWNYSVNYLFNDKETYKIAKEYSEHILHTYQELLKLSAERSDIDSFKMFIKNLNVLFKYLGYLTEKSNVEKEVLDNIHSYLKKRKILIYFGLASWILSKYNHDIKEFLKTLEIKINSYTANKIVNLTQLLIDIDYSELDEKLGWNSWEFREIPEGEVGSINFSDKLEDFYIYQCIKNYELFNTIELPTNKDFSFKIDRFITKLNCFDFNKYKLEKDQEKINGFIALLKKAKEKQNLHDIQITIDSPIDQNKIESFKQEFLESYKLRFKISSIFKKYNKVRDHNELIETLKVDENEYGIKQLINKIFFLPDDMLDKLRTINVEGTGSKFADSIRGGEDSIILKHLKNDCEEINYDFLKNNQKEINSKWFIIAVNSAIYKFMKSNQDYTPKWFLKKDLDDPNIEGTLKLANIELPVYQLFDGKSKEDYFLLLNSNKIGMIYNHPFDFDSNNMFKLSIDELKEGEPEFEKLINNPPEWLSEIGNSEEQKNYLKERVGITIFKRIVYSDYEGIEGYKVTLKGNPKIHKN